MLTFHVLTQWIIYLSMADLMRLDYWFAIGCRSIVIAVGILITCSYKRNRKLQDGHSIEVQTHAGHLIVFSMFLHFVILWPWPLPFCWKNHTTCRISQDHSVYQVWRLWDHSSLSYAADRHTESDIHTDAAKRFTHATVVGVSYNSNNNNVTYTAQIRTQLQMRYIACQC